jgi:hypothetical protein
MQCVYSFYHCSDRSSFVRGIVIVVMSSSKASYSPDDFAPPTASQEAITLHVDWTEEDERKAKRK